MQGWLKIEGCILGVDQSYVSGRWRRDRKRIKEYEGSV